MSELNTLTKSSNISSPAGYSTIPSNSQSSTASLIDFRTDFKLSIRKRQAKSRPVDNQLKIFNNFTESNIQIHSLVKIDPELLCFSDINKCFSLKTFIETILNQINRAKVESELVASDSLLFSVALLNATTETNHLSDLIIENSVTIIENLLFIIANYTREDLIYECICIISNLLFNLEDSSEKMAIAVDLLSQNAIKLLKCVTSAHILNAYGNLVSNAALAKSETRQFDLSLIFPEEALNIFIRQLSYEKSNHGLIFSLCKILKSIEIANFSSQAWQSVVKLLSDYYKNCEHMNLGELETQTKIIVLNTLSHVADNLNSFEGYVSLFNGDVHSAIINSTKALSKSIHLPLAQIQIFISLASGIEDIARYLLSDGCLRFFTRLLLAYSDSTPIINYLLTALYNLMQCFNCESTDEFSDFLQNDFLSALFKVLQSASLTNTVS